jgi:hypothetical protein
MIPVDIRMYTGFPRCVLALATQTSTGRHGQPCTPGMASKETGKYHI